MDVSRRVNASFSYCLDYFYLQQQPHHHRHHSHYPYSAIVSDRCSSAPKEVKRTWFSTTTFSSTNLTSRTDSESSIAAANDADHRNGKENEDHHHHHAYACDRNSRREQQQLSMLPTGSMPLGVPLPLDAHACSVSLPTWSSVVGYEEGEPSVMNALTLGYPRFVYHPYILALMQVVLQQQHPQRRRTSRTGGDDNDSASLDDELSKSSESSGSRSHSSGSGYNDNRAEEAAEEAQEEDCLLLPTAAAAERCRRFLVHVWEENHGSVKTPILLLDNAFDHCPNEECTAADQSAAAVAAEIASSATVTSSSSSSFIRTVAIPEAGVFAVVFPAQTRIGMEAKAYWQHTGEVVSSRRAQAALQVLKMEIPRMRMMQMGGDSSNSDFSNHENNDKTTAAKVKTEPTSSSSSSSSSLLNLNLNPFDALRNSIATWEEKHNNIHHAPFDVLRARIGNWANVPPNHVFLTPSGMASIYLALRSSRRYKLLISAEGKEEVRQQQQRRGGVGEGGRGGGRSIVYGFPYLDTLKLCSRVEFCPDGVEFFGLGDAHDLNHLSTMLSTSSRKLTTSSSSSNSSSMPQSYCCLITEIPSNPLLQCPDLVALRALADKYDFCLVVDDTISNFFNSNLLESGLADAVCTSLTKLVSGRGDVMAGSLIANPYTEKGRWLQQDLQRQHQQQLQIQQPHNASLHSESDAFGLFAADARAVLLNSSDFEARNDRINATAEDLADWLNEHDDVERVYYPKLTEPCLYKNQIQKATGGYGGLMSITLHSHMCQRSFYDHLDVPKGPSLGTNFTLVCPYTLLAHYHELDFALSCRVPPNLLRISVGLESLESLQGKFEHAFHKSRLHQKKKKKACTSSADRHSSSVLQHHQTISTSNIS